MFEADSISVKSIQGEASYQQRTGTTSDPDSENMGSHSASKRTSPAEIRRRAHQKRDTSNSYKISTATTMLAQCSRQSTPVEGTPLDGTYDSPVISKKESNSLATVAVISDKETDSSNYTDQLMVTVTSRTAKDGIDLDVLSHPHSIPSSEKQSDNPLQGALAGLSLAEASEPRAAKSKPSQYNSFESLFTTAPSTTQPNGSSGLLNPFTRYFVTSVGERDPVRPIEHLTQNVIPSRRSKLHDLQRLTLDETNDLYNQGR